MLPRALQKIKKRLDIDVLSMYARTASVSLTADCTYLMMNFFVSIWLSEPIYVSVPQNIINIRKSAVAVQNVSRKTRLHVMTKSNDMVVQINTGQFMFASNGFKESLWMFCYLRLNCHESGKKVCALKSIWNSGNFQQKKSIRYSLIVVFPSLSILYLLNSQEK